MVFCKYRDRKYDLIMENDMNLNERARKLKTDIPAVFLALKDKETPLTAKVFAALTVAYALSPIDFIPDFIPVIGYLDDLVLLPLLVALTIRFIPDDVLGRCRTQSEGMWNDGKPEKWYYAIPIVLVWVVIIVFALKLVW